MTRNVRRRVSFGVTASSGKVSGLFHRPADAWSLLVLAHGAGAGMEHAFMTGVAGSLFDVGVATLRYQFPYMEAGRKRPDAPKVAQQTVRSAVAKAASLAPDLPLLAGGKSFGGRMTSSAAATAALAGVRGIVFLGFPLHAPGRVGDERGAHLFDVDVPMLFLQGTRDALADLTRVRPLCRKLGTRATLRVVDGGDHSFNVLKRSGRTADDVMTELCEAIIHWARAITP
jgi:predicted alpha/beta-hydrolase family hydrolase